MKLLHSILLVFVHKIIMYPFLKFIMGARAKNRFINPSKSNVVFVANHSSHVDTLFVLSHLPISDIHRTRAVAASDYFESTKLKSFLSSVFVNVLMISRFRKDHVASGISNNPIEKMLNQLAIGNNLLLFPEGTRGQDNNIGKFKPGISRLLLKSPKTQYVPIYIHDTHKILAKNQYLPTPHKFTITFGLPTFIDPHKDEFENTLIIRDDILKLKDAILF